MSAAISYIAARPDDSHTALTWSAPLRALATEPITAARQLRIALQVEDLTLHALDENGLAARSFALPGHTVAQGHSWLSEVSLRPPWTPRGLPHASTTPYPPTRWSPARDDSYAEPYWYVGPYPYPPVIDLPPLAGGGHWHTEGWVGAVLPASDYIGATDQRPEVSAFTDSAVAACRRLLGG